MPGDRPPELYPIGYDERQEAWFVTVAEGVTLPLDRATLGHLVDCYNSIHRGAALALLERRALVELGDERRALQETVHSLYEFIDTTPPAAGWRARLACLWARCTGREPQETPRRRPSSAPIAARSTERQPR